MIKQSRFILCAFVFIYLIYSCPVSARELLFNCPLDAKPINQQIIQNWSVTPMPWFSSWSHSVVNGFTFVGGLRTYDNQLPRDLNPHLNFKSAVFTLGRYEGEYELDCVYDIHNPEIFDMNKSLYLRTFIQASRCWLKNATTLSCAV